MISLADSTSQVAVSVLDNDSAPVGSLLPGSIIILDQPSQGSVFVNQVTGVIDYLPSPGFSGIETFTYQVSSTNGEDSNSATVMLEVGGPTDPDADRLTQGNDNVSLSSANDIVDALGGDDVVLGNNGADVIYGNLGNDELNGGKGEDILFGGSGNDILIGGNQSDILVGGSGTNTLFGGKSADTFRFVSLDAFDTVEDFEIVSGEALDVSALLVGYTPGVDAIGDFVRFTNSGSDTIMAINADGGAAGFVDIALIRGLTNRDAAAMEANGSLVTVGPSTNDAPTPVADAATTSEENAVVVDVLTNDSDPNGDALSVVSVSQGTNGSVVNNNDGTVTYTPDLDFAGSDSFTYTVDDGAGGQASTTVTVTVTNVNDGPVAAGDSAATSATTPVVINVLANDTDADGDSLSVSSLGSATGGSVVNNNDGTVTFTPTGGFEGQGSFSYTVADGNGGTDTATVTVDVFPPNDPPVAGDDSASTQEDTAVVVTVLGNDTDPDGDPLTVTGASDGSNGTTVVNGNGTVTYTPNAEFSGQDTFTYTVDDGKGGTDTATVTVTVNSVNDAPVAGDDAASTSVDTPVVIDVLANDSDVEGDTLTITNLGTSPNGVLSDNGNGTLTYTPNTGFSGQDTLTYTIDDGNGGSDTASITVDVSSGDPTDPNATSPTGPSSSPPTR
ncbi:MAG: tandem-95 repeat protein, partial [Planctomycetota bacterium]